MSTKRVAVMSPQTRLARSRRRLRGPWRMPRLDPGDTDRALRAYRRQRRRGAVALAATATMLLGLAVLFALAPALTELRLFGVRVSWLLLAVLPYPIMVCLAWWQLRRAEAAEDDPADHRTGRAEGGIGRADAAGADR
ncbi:MAG: hypothetical protein GEV04_00160 [Actinophytocola sp.]|nr:hypothetical protein [Actinophytocola sp.]